METRENYPFIYFYAVLNIVFVYRIEKTNTITPTELIGSMKAYEINNFDEFELFNHQDRNELKNSGRSFFINFEDMNRMAEEINKHIQNHQM